MNGKAQLMAIDGGQSSDGRAALVEFEAFALRTAAGTLGNLGCLLPDASTVGSEMLSWSADLFAAAEELAPAAEDLSLSPSELSLSLREPG